ncbi:hypothetical protein IC617_03905 [Neiella sp. HB171785]|uniref:Uncharacterized protein n=1 Tax=Neiella litorisoli TaxID=2771431 RepID=A0A8J6UIJ2_9GAMM|nr:hypothetical protein [Neiella litorisoli]MBD1388563.1 hypothetical protein [Neiella litorisoli]
MFRRKRVKAKRAEAETAHHAIYRTLIDEAGVVIVDLRHGGETSNFMAAGNHVRAVISDFGPHPSFILTPNTKDWLIREYKLTEEQASMVYRRLFAQVQKRIKEIDRDKGHTPYLQPASATAARICGSGPSKPTLFGEEY